MLWKPQTGWESNVSKSRRSLSNDNGFNHCSVLDEDMLHILRCDALALNQTFMVDDKGSDAERPAGIHVGVVTQQVEKGLHCWMKVEDCYAILLLAFLSTQAG